MTLYIDTETTGLYENDEIVEIAIIDDNQTLLNTLVKPVNHSSWPEAQEIHGITPAMVSDAPTYAEIRSQIRNLVKDQDVVIYNADYDSQYLYEELKSAASVRCAMLAFAREYGEWNDYYENYRWQKLTKAARYVLHKWEGSAHRALADTQATRSVWKYLNDPEERKRVDEIWEERRLIDEAKEALSYIEYKKQQKEEDKAKAWSDFLQVWWLKQPPFRHWAKRNFGFVAQNELCDVFYGHPLWLIQMEDRATTVYRKKKDIPDSLVSLSYFKRNIDNACGTWFDKQLRPSGAVYIGKKTGWDLYDISEYKRIKQNFPLKFVKPYLPRSSGEILITKTDARKMKINLSGIDPYCETQTGYGDWYYLYKVKVPQKESV